jgi:ATP-dependent Lhr-like helicase
VFERFFDESGGMQLVIHSPFGARINKAYGLALRKRFCRAFNFELQAAATEDAIVLSLGETHSFELESIKHYLHSNTVEQVLTQAVLDAPLFTTRWRWNAAISLAVRRNQGGKRTPPPLQRMAAEDLISVVFPDQIACAENLTGEREIPDHPLVNQTLDDCLHEAMDVEGLKDLLRAIERGEKQVIARDLPTPSPLSQEILTARPYAYLDDAPLEERRTQAVASRRWSDPETAADLGKLDPAAIAQVREEAWPSAENPDELHDALISLGLITEEEGMSSNWTEHLAKLNETRRAARLYIRVPKLNELHIAAEKPVKEPPAKEPPQKDPPSKEPPVKEPGKQPPVMPPGPKNPEIIPPGPKQPEIEPPGKPGPGEVPPPQQPPDQTPPTEIPTPGTPHPGNAPIQASPRASAETPGDGTSALEENAPGVMRERAFWVAAEMLPMLAAIYPEHRLDPQISAPAESAARTWAAEEALVELVRGRLQGLGPVTIASMVESLGLTPTKIEAALTTLESEGFVLRGQFTGNTLQARREGNGLPPTIQSADDPGTQTEWCERRLLARIHRYTIRTLRAEIEPVSTADFMRFLLEWQGVTRQPRPEGLEALAGVIAQLEGYEIPAAAWESDVLAARLNDYDPNWLDSLCLSGRALWARLTPSKSMTAAPVRATPIALLTRKNWSLWHSLSEESRDEMQLSHPARAMAEYLGSHGASFFEDIVTGTGLLKSQAESGLGELVAAGIVNADSYSGLRALLIPSDRKRRMAARGRRIATFGLEDAGRWSLIRKGKTAAGSEAVEQIAQILLRRYGVVFRRVLEREADWLPPWHQLLRVYRRLEAQGTIRGGRFVAGMSGEQYALPDAVGALRAVRRRESTGDLVSLSAADPLNLAGIITPGQKVPALASNRILLRDGVPVATHAGGQTEFLEKMEPADEWAARQALLHKRMSTPPSARPS